MPPQEDKVWISREEYDRLRQAESRPVPMPVYQGPTVVGSQVQPVNGSSTNILQSLIAITLGLGFVASLTNESFRWLAPPIAVIFFIFGIFTLVQYYRKHPKYKGNAVVPESTSATVVKAVFVMVGAVLLVPVVLGGGFMLLILFMMAGSGGKGS